MTLDPASLVTIKGLEAKFSDPDGTPLFPAATIRGWIHANLDRFKERCVVKPGGKVLVDLAAFSAWLEDRRGAPSDRITLRHRREVRRRQVSGEAHPLDRAIREGLERHRGASPCRSRTAS